MRAKFVVRLGLALIALVGALALCAAPLIPGSAPVAFGQTPGPLNPFPSPQNPSGPGVLPGTLPITVGQTAAPSSGFPPPTPGTQVCLNGQVLPTSIACQIFPITSGVPFTYSQPPCVLIPGSCTAPTKPTAQTATNAGQPVASNPAPAPEPPAPLPAGPLMATSTETVSANQQAVITAQTNVVDAQTSQSTTVQVASATIPPASACAGNGTATITLTASNTGGPLAVTIDGTCSSGAPLSFSSPVTVCVTVQQSLQQQVPGAASEHPILIDSSYNELPGVTFDGVQLCGQASAPGTYTVAIDETAVSALPSS